MLLAYMDGSGTHEGSPVLSISGFVADESAWTEFDHAWRSILAKPSWPSRLTEFHMVECAHGYGEFFDGRWTFAERLALYGELTDVIIKSQIRPISSSVITSCLQQVSASDLALLRREENRLGTPTDLAFHMLVQQILFHVRESHPFETVGVLFDRDSKKVQERFSDFSEHYIASFHLGDVFAGYNFGDSKAFTPLQAADLLAYGTIHLVQAEHCGMAYEKPDFPVVPAFWEMLLRLAELPSSSPVGKLINLAALKSLLQKVKAKEVLPKKARPAR